MLHDECIIHYQPSPRKRAHSRKGQAIARRLIRQAVAMLSFSLIVFIPAAILGGIEAGRTDELPGVIGCLVCIAAGSAIAKRSGIMT